MDIQTSKFKKWFQCHKKNIITLKSEFDKLSYFPNEPSHCISLTTFAKVLFKSNPTYPIIYEY